MQNPNHRPILPAHQMPPQQQHQQQQTQRQQQPTQQQANQQPLQPTLSQAPATNYVQQYHFQRFPIPPAYAGYPPHMPSGYVPQFNTQTPYPSWQNPAGYQPSMTPAPALNQTGITTPPVNSQKTREKKILTFIHPDTREAVELPNNTTRTKVTNDTNKNANQVRDKSEPTNASTPTRVVTIKAPPATTATGQAIATTTSSQLSISTAKSGAAAQTCTTQAKTLTTSSVDTNSISVDEVDKSSPNVVSVTTTTGSTVAKISGSEDASSLAVRSQFANKASELVAEKESGKTKSEAVEGSISPSKSEDAVDPGKEVESKVDEVNITIKKDEDSKKEIKSNNDIDIDEKKKDPSGDEIEGGGEVVSNSKSDEIDENDGKKITSDDSNKENKNGSDESEEGELHYEPGQYNPKTKQGKRKYDKKFLLAINDIIAIEFKNDLDPLNCPVEPPDFTPAWQKNYNHGLEPRSNDPSRRPNHQYYGGRSSDRQERQKKIILTSSLGQEVELKTSSNPWRPGNREQEVKVDGTESEIENLKKQFRSILNKLTPNNFDSLAEKVSTLKIDTETKLGDVIDIVFAKALSEPGYSVLYGRMCSHLKKISAGKAEFGTTLLKRCQNQFQTDIYSGLDVAGREKKIEEEEDPDKKKHMSEELYEDMYRCRLRGLGLIKFIGELYKIDMLNDTIMFSCILKLLTDISDESIECLCDLLATIGEKLDNSSKEYEKSLKRQKNQGAPKANAYQSGQKSAAAIVAQGPAQPQPQMVTNLDPIFESLHKIRKDNDNKLSLRLRFKILDICELRENENWQSKKTKENNPKKLEEIREAHMEKLESEKRRDAIMGPRRSQEGRRGGLGHSSGSSSQISSLANEQGGNRGGSGMHMSASSQSIRDHASNETVRNQEDYAKNKLLAVKVLTSRNLTSSGASSGSLRPTMKKQ